MQVFTYILLGFLVVCAISVSLSKNLLNSVLIYMSYSLVMSVIWILLESPDLAITEAAVGAGITSLLFFLTLKKIHAIVDDDPEADGEKTVKEEQESIFETDRDRLQGDPQALLSEDEIGVRTAGELMAEGMFSDTAGESVEEDISGIVGASGQADRTGGEEE